MIIELTQGFVTHVDAEDYDVLMHFYWHAAQCGKHTYAQGHVYGKKRFMHRFLMGEPEGIEIDHRDQDDLNNRRGNLRHSQHHQNLSNRSLQRNNVTGFKGVHFHPKSGLWGARIKHLNRYCSIGYHETAEEAARYYNLKALELHGKFACLNKVDPAFPVFIRSITSGFGIKGELNPTSKLMWKDVEAIRKSTENQYDLAREYGVSQSSISQIQLFKTWNRP